MAGNSKSWAEQVEEDEMEEGVMPERAPPILTLWTATSNESTVAPLVSSPIIPTSPASNSF